MLCSLRFAFPALLLGDYIGTCHKRGIQVLVSQKMASTTHSEWISTQLPPVDYENTEAPDENPVHLPSVHISFDNKDIKKLGLKDGSTWSNQTEEFCAYLKNGKKVKRVLWVRHGEGIHNAAEREFGSHYWETHEAKKEKYFDPDLNAVGFEQGLVLSRALQPHLEDPTGLKVDLIVVSPLTRAIRTAELAFAKIWDQVPVVAVELARERHGKNICDKRRTVTQLRAAFPTVSFDKHMFAEEDLWHTERRETPEEVRERVKRLMHWLMEVPAMTIAVVGHSDFMSHAVEVAGFEPHWPANCEMVPMMISITHIPMNDAEKEAKKKEKSPRLSEHE